jgi:hypothetical protein
MRISFAKTDQYGDVDKIASAKVTPKLAKIFGEIPKGSIVLENSDLLPKEFEDLTKKVIVVLSNS